jgi:hypothetical protein
MLEYKAIILFTGLYCKTWSLNLTAEHKTEGISEHDRGEKHISVCEMWSNDLHKLFL